MPRLEASSSHTVITFKLVPSFIKRAKHAGADHALLNSRILLNLSRKYVSMGGFFSMHPINSPYQDAPSR